MNIQLVKGVACICITALLIWYAYRNKENQNRALSAILLTGLLLRLFASLDPFLHDWDERFHALVAKNLMADMLTPMLNKITLFEYDYRDWTNNHIWLHKPPLALWTMSVSMKLFGINELALRLPSILLSTISILLTYKIAHRLYPQKPNIALLASFFQTINGFVIEISSGRIPTDHVDTMLLFWIELGIWYSICAIQDGVNYKKTTILGVITAMAILCKWYVALLIPFTYFIYSAISHHLYVKAILQTLFILIAAMAISGIWTMYAYSHFTDEFLWEQKFNTRHLFETIEGHSGEWWYFIEKARINWNEGIYVCFIFLLFQLFSKRNKSDFLILVWVLLPYIIFSASSTKMEGYVLIAAPAIFLMISTFCISLLEIEKNKKIWSLVAGLTVLFAVRYCIERVKPFYQNPSGQHQKECILKLTSLLPNSENTLVINNKLNIETMFYSNIVSLRTIPSEAYLQKAKQNFKDIAVIDDGNLPPHILKDSSVRVIVLP